MARAPLRRQARGSNAQQRGSARSLQVTAACVWPQLPCKSSPASTNVAQRAGTDCRTGDTSSLGSDLTAAQRTPGRVAAQLMFGLWRNLLDTGSDIGDHTNANPARCAPTTKLCGAPSCGTPSPASGWRRASAVRSSLAPEPSVWSSRCTPCATAPPTTKPLVNGFPLPGEQRCLSAAQGHRACLQLARLLDRDLATWLSAHSQMARQLPREPALQRRPRRQRLPARSTHPS